MEYKVINPGEILYDDCSGYYYDQLCGIEPDYSGYDYWIFKSNMRRYLENTYGLSQQQYYNIVVYGDINYTHECEYEECHEATEFVTLCKGYKKGCCIEHGNYVAWQNEERRELQSEVGKASMEVVNEMLWESPEYEDFRKRQSERMREVMIENNSNPDYQKKAICSGNRSYAINNFGERSIIYMWTRDEDLKIGVCGTLDNVYQKINTFCPEKMIAFEGKTTETAEMEYQIKMNNEAVFGNEFFELNKFEEFYNLMSTSFKEVFRKGF